MDNNIKEQNERILELAHIYLDNDPTYVKQGDIERVDKLNLDSDYAFALILANVLNVNTSDPSDKEFFNSYFREMIHGLSPKTYQDNPYIRTVHLKNKHIREWEIKERKYKPYEGFFTNDIKVFNDGRKIPQIGYFKVPYKYPAIYRNDHLWLSLNPYEIESMKEPIEEAKGNVLNYGLRLGYFAFMASLKDEVRSITIIERNPFIIEIFSKYVLPLFPHREKIRIIKMDALKYAESIKDASPYDFIFAGIWHGVSDGQPIYRKLKELENKKSNIVYRYWIENLLNIDN